ncbi:thiamine-monophosphate kinase [Ktedonobacteria bacterium brp13]|nr:thiamine-monophosphate kinase [Ktedonobacteria bacterium brp13]
MDISELGEFGLIARLTSGLATRSPQDIGIGDDCAVLDLAADRLLLATCDSQVEHVHFTLQTSSPVAIGRKALAINLSDIAAMGGTPLYALISLVLPAHLPVATLDGIYAGLRELALRYDTALVGGNVSGTGQRGEQLIIDITVLGSVERGRALLRSGAHPGDLLCVTGTPGDSGAGFYSLQHPTLPVDTATLAYLHERHTSPTPRVFEGRVLSSFDPGWVTAALDISDGLSGDLSHLCESSGVGARLDLARLPRSSALRTLARVAEHDPYAWALHGGEDYELLFSVAPEHAEAVAQAVLAQTGTAVTIIGTVLPPAEGMQLVYPDGHAEQLTIQSWDHLKQ